MARLVSVAAGLAVACGAAGSCESTTTIASPVADVAVTPPLLVVSEGSALKLNAILRDEAARLLQGRTVTWLSLDPGVASVDQSGLVRGVRKGSTRIEASSEGVVGSAAVDVLTAARIVLDRPGVAFDAFAGAGAPPPVTVGITNAGEAELAGINAAIGYLEGAPGWLSASLSAPTAPSVLTLTATVDGLSSGSYSARVEISSPDAANSPQPVAVSLIVSDAPPRIVLSTGAVSFNARKEAPDPPPAVVQVDNGGSGALGGLAAAVRYDRGAPGWLTATLSGTDAPATLQLAASAVPVAPDTFQATVIVTAPSAVNSPDSVLVTFVVLPRAGAAGGIGPVAGRGGATPAGSGPDGSRAGPHHRSRAGAGDP